MNAVGIDVSKGKSMVTVLRPGGEVVVAPHMVTHTSSELSALAKTLKSLDGDTKVVMEHTGRYYEPIAQMLYDAGLFVSAVNPLLIKEFGNNSLRRVKTDKADSVKIARYALDNWCELRQHTDMDTTRYQLKTLNRQYDLYVRTKTAQSNNLISLLDQSYPGANKLFDSPARTDGSQKWVDFVYTFYHVDCVRNMSLNAFTERYRKWCRRRGYNFSAEKAVEIHTGAKELVPMLPKDACSKLLIQQAAGQLTATSKAVETLKAEMNNLASQLPEYPAVMTLYGAGEATGPQLMAEIGDVRRFAKRNSLIAFAGVDPMPSQSGTYEATSNATSKRGSPLLRKTLFNIMTVLIQRAPADDPVFQFIDKKRAEGKPYYVYMTAGANKFLRIYYGRVKEYLATLDDLPPVDYDSTGFSRQE